MTTAWPEVALGDICQFKYGKSMPASARSGLGFPVFGSNGEVGRHEDALTSGPTIVVGRKGSFGEVHFSESACWPIDTTYFIDESATSQDLRWLFYLLGTLGLTELNRAAAIPGLNRADAYRKRFPLPPLDEQRRIAAILDKADEIRSKRKAALETLEALSQAIFIEMFGDPVTNPMGWVAKNLSEIADTASGGTPDRKNKSFFEGDVPWVKSGELAQRKVTSTEEAISEAAIESSAAKVLPKGTLLLAMYGATAGETSTLGLDAATNQAICSIKPGDQVHSDFLLVALELMKTKLLSQTVGGAQPNLNQGIIRSLKIPVPPLDLQARFHCLESDVIAALVQQETAVQVQNELFASLQQTAFQGAL